MNNDQYETLNAKLDCIIDLIGLNGELIKCTLAAQTGADNRYRRAVERYDEMFKDEVQKCFERLQKVDRSLHFDELTVEDAQRLNDAARRTCEFEATSEVGDEA